MANPIDSGLISNTLIDKMSKLIKDANLIGRLEYLVIGYRGTHIVNFLAKGNKPRPFVSFKTFVRLIERFAPGEYELVPVLVRKGDYSALERIKPELQKTQSEFLAKMESHIKVVKDDPNNAPTRTVRKKAPKVEVAKTDVNHLFDEAPAGGDSFDDLLNGTLDGLEDI